MIFAVGPFGDVDGSLTKSLLTADPNRAEFRRFYELTFGKRPAEELYDLRKDPGEIDNRAADADYTTIKRRLAERLRKWREATGDPRLKSDDDRWDEYPYYGGPAKNPSERKTK